jgi:two-component system sensor histidine kinase AlgZ
LESIKPQSFQQMNLIPDFCRGRSVFTLALAMELVAFVLTLASSVHGEEAIYHLALLSLYLQWIGLCSAAALCWARRWLRIVRPRVVFFVCWGMLVVIATAIGELAYDISTLIPIYQGFPNEPRAAFVIRSACISAIVSLLLLRYFWLRHEWRAQITAEGESRYQALNARIQPHFLFNSLNSIAAMISIKPGEAELMVEDLSDLFRASMERRNRIVPLVDEVALVHSYLRIEKVRMADRLRVEWDIPEELLGWRVPMLVIQPLVENAVHHGISKLREPGVIRIRARELRNRLVIEVENPVPPQDAEKKHGNRIAVDNIAQRLQLIYGDKALLELGLDRNLEGAIFRARLTLPLAAQTQLQENGEPQ